MKAATRAVGITGGSCSGKTGLSRNLATRFGDRLTLFAFDDMFVGLAAIAGKDITDWEDPGLYRWDDLLSHLQELKTGNPITILANESRERKVPEKLYIEPRPILAVVGFLALHKREVRELFDTTIYLDVPETEIIRRRLERAAPNDPWDTAEYITGELIAGHRRFVLPQRAIADHVLDATLPPDRVADMAAAIIRG